MCLIGKHWGIDKLQELALEDMKKVMAELRKLLFAVLFRL